MPSLFNINQRYMALKTYASSEDVDEISLKDTFDSIEGELEDKADAIAYVLADIDGDIETRTKEINRLKGMNEADEKAKERLKKALWDSMVLHDKPKFKTSFHSFGIVNNGGQKPLVFTGGKADVKAIDKRFVKTVEEVDNSAIREALDNGEELGFAWYGERGQRLSIK